MLPYIADNNNCNEVSICKNKVMHKRKHGCLGLYLFICGIRIRLSSWLMTESLKSSVCTWLHGRRVKWAQRMIQHFIDISMTTTKDARNFFPIPHQSSRNSRQLFGYHFHIETRQTVKEQLLLSCFSPSDLWSGIFSYEAWRPWTALSSIFPKSPSYTVCLLK